jgi:hypothetical protein
MQAVTPEPQLVTRGRDPSTPAAAKRARSASGRKERSVGVQQVGVRQAGRARDVAAAHAGARLRRGAGETAGSARVQHQLGPRRDVAQHVADTAQACGAIIGPERSGSRRGNGRSPVSVARPSRSHLGSPPSSTAAASWPNRPISHQPRAAEARPFWS